MNVTKSKVVRPMRSNFLGFSFLKYKGEWKAVPMKDRKKKLYDKTRQILCRKRACARTIGETFKRLNWLIRGWINYYGIGVMSSFIEKYGYWIRRKVRVVILKQWKNPKRIYINLLRLCKLLKYKFTEREVYIAAYNSHGWYRRANHPIVRFTICPKLLSRAKEDRPGLIDPLKYYLSRA